MRFTKQRLFAPLMVGLASTALALLAVAAFGEVPNDGFSIDDSKESAAGANLDLTGSSYGAQVVVECAPASTPDSAVGTTVIVTTNHPDKSKLAKEKGGVEQARKDNPAVFRVITGEGDAEADVILTCDEASAGAAVKTSKSPDQGKFEAKAKNCVCSSSTPGNTEQECTDHDARIEQIAADCDGLKSIKLDVSGSSITKVKIKGKGDASVEPS